MSAPPSGFGCYTLPPSFSPDQVASLVAWYDTASAVFDGSGGLSNWTDKTINCNTITQVNSAGPTGLYFTQQNASTSLRLPLSNSGATIFAVIQLSNITIGQYNNIVSIMNSNFQNPGYSNSNYTLSIGAVTATDYYIESYDLYNITADPTNKYTAGTQRLLINGICFNSNFGSSYSRSYLDGALANRSAAAITLSSNRNDFNIFLGDYTTITRGVDNQFHVGKHYIYEVLVYNSVLTESQISQINRYLQAKNGTAALANSGNFTY